MDMGVIDRTCPTCCHHFGQPDDLGRKRRLPSECLKQTAYRARRPATASMPGPPDRIPRGDRAGWAKAEQLRAK